jgi:hypothetical protein
MLRVDLSESSREQYEPSQQWTSQLTALAPFFSLLRPPWIDEVMSWVLGEFYHNSL